MSEWHYHANHINAPARGSKAAALKDARALHVAYQQSGWFVDSDVTAENLRAHGAEFPAIVRCFRGDCRITARPLSTPTVPA